MGVYVTTQLASQFCTNVFSMFVLCHTAHISQWDRESAIVTKLILYNSNSSLAKFFSQLMHTLPELRGIDTTVIHPTGDKAACARERLGLGLDIPMFKTSVPTEGGSQSLMIIFAKPSAHPSLPACHVTCACPAYDVFGDWLVFFKDSWHIATDDITSEGKIYADLNMNGVSFVLMCLTSGDVECRDEQKTQTQQCSWSPWACQKKLHILPHSHYQLILDIMGIISLMEFSSSKELVQAIHDALLGYKRCLLLGIHRDVSPGNIIIFNAHGYLIDWDLAKLIRLPYPRHATCTGTWQFMSTHLMEDVGVHHIFLDDLESSFWMLLWTALLMFSQSKLDTKSLVSFIKRTFKSSPGGEEKCSVLMSQTKLTPNLFLDCSALYLLVKELADLFKGIYYMPSPDELAVYKALKSKFQNSPDLPRILQVNNVHLQVESLERLKNHKYVISCFS
ncbi:hypothetical protein JVT61DRAFT_11471 [Boletus reticuloceps]|uniref:Fungal-type protein kinase domain-containing protein n=1 Tax=Boletus reticuloceps TaxID=495285 RepID=A0A8I3AE44_9AGAM|nr:hypothetical protein JVT61DRAFT_11471 [Boletus reticuloceps]